MLAEVQSLCLYLGGQGSFVKCRILVRLAASSSKQCIDVALFLSSLTGIFSVWIARLPGQSCKQKAWKFRWPGMQTVAYIRWIWCLAQIEKNTRSGHAVPSAGAQPLHSLTVPLIPLEPQTSHSVEYQETRDIVCSCPGFQVMPLSLPQILRIVRFLKIKCIST